MIDPDVLLVLLLTLVILLPIVPAFLLFRYLDAGADVYGPWHGLNLKLGGAFAAYFVVALMALSAYGLMKPPKPDFEVWDVTGNMTDSNNRDIGPVSLQDFSSTPSWMDDPVAGAFHMYVFTRPGPGHTTQYPNITIRRGSDSIAHFSLDPKQATNPDSPRITWNVAQRQVTIQAVPFMHIASYNDQQAPIVPTVAGTPAAGAQPK